MQKYHARARPGLCMRRRPTNMFFSNITSLLPKLNDCSMKSVVKIILSFTLFTPAHIIFSFQISMKWKVGNSFKFRPYFILITELKFHSWHFHISFYQSNRSADLYVWCEPLSYLLCIFHFAEHCANILNRSYKHKKAQRKWESYSQLGFQ